MRAKQLAFRFPGGRDMDFERFVPGPNAELLEGLYRLCMGELERPIYLWGGPGSGKTHLLFASQMRAAGLGRESAYHSLAQSDPATCLETAHKYALLCLDDVQCIAGDPSRELALLDLYERMQQGGGGLLLAADCAPSTLPLKLDDLRSRLSWGLVYRLHPLVDADKVQALQLRAKARSFQLPKEVAGYLLTRFPRDMHSLFALFERIDTTSLESGRKLSVPFVREHLQGL